MSITTTFIFSTNFSSYHFGLFMVELPFIITQSIRPLSLPAPFNVEFPEYSFSIFGAYLAHAGRKRVVILIFCRRFRPRLRRKFPICRALEPATSRRTRRIDTALRRLKGIITEHGGVEAGRYRFSVLARSPTEKMREARLRLSSMICLSSSSPDEAHTFMAGELSFYWLRRCHSLHCQCHYSSYYCRCRISEYAAIYRTARRSPPMTRWRWAFELYFYEPHYFLCISPGCIAGDDYWCFDAAASPPLLPRNGRRSFLCV